MRGQVLEMGVTMTIEVETPVGKVQGVLAGEVAAMPSRGALEEPGAKTKTVLEETTKMMKAVPAMSLEVA